MFKNILVSNFRSLKKVGATNFGDVNLITGGNGSGKSTLLEALFLNAGGTNARLILSLNNLRGDDEISHQNDSVFHSLFSNLDASKNIDIKCHYELGNTKVNERNLRITPRIKKQGTVGETGVEAFVDGLDLEFSTKLVHAKKPKLAKGHIAFDRSEAERVLELSKPNEDTIISCRYVSPLSSNVRDTADRLSRIVKAKELDQVVDLLKIVDPRISGVTALSEDGRNHVYVDIGLRNLISATYMGGGFIRLLNLAVSIIQDKILLIDEIENGLHYTIHAPLIHFIFSAVARLKRQVFITTHSEEFLDTFVNSMDEFSQLDLRAFRCSKGESEVIVQTYSEEELGLRKQLDIELR